MKYVEVIAETGSIAAISAIAKEHEARDFRLGVVGEDGIQQMRLVLADDKLQSVLDALQNALGKNTQSQIMVLPVEIALPVAKEEERKEEDAATETREALYESVEKDARLDRNFIILVLLSTVVAAIGLIENNMAVVIGAMVIAPLLGPNLAFGIGTALGDISLMRKSALTNSVGLALSVGLSVIIGIFWPFDVKGPMLVMLTTVGIDSVVLALASGAAAALSLTTGLSSVLVGVMVAVALLPPAATLGLMLGRGNTDLAMDSGLMLAINVVCINLASKVVFFIKGIRPRTWWEKGKAKRAMVIYVIVWFVTLVILVFITYTRKTLEILQ